MIIDEYKPSANNICGIVVTYNGAKTIGQTLQALSKNVNNLVIVDNNSADETLELIRDLNLDKLHIITNEQNKGIAAALNMGVDYARSKDFAWVLTMDQDSILQANAVVSIGQVYEQLPAAEKDKLACLAANPIINRQKTKGSARSNSKSKRRSSPRCSTRASRRNSTGSPGGKYVKKKTVITSGNVVKTACLTEIGGYEEKLFIDSVDFDFCLKLNELKKNIYLCSEAGMIHELGQVKAYKCLGREFYVYTHSPVRDYYISRNHIYIIKRFFKSAPLFCLKKTIFFLLYIIKNIIFAKERWKSVSMIFTGIRHGFMGLYGPMEESFGGAKI